MYYHIFVKFAFHIPRGVNNVCHTTIKSRIFVVTLLTTHDILNYLKIQLKSTWKLNAISSKLLRSCGENGLFLIMFNLFV